MTDETPNEVVEPLQVYAWLREDLENAARNYFEFKLADADIELERPDVKRFLDGIVKISGQALFEEMRKLTADLMEAENTAMTNYETYAGLVQE